MSERIELVLHDFLQGLLTIPEASRAVIEAMREPTEEMVAAVTSYEEYGPAAADNAREYWRLMINGAFRASPRVVRVPHRGVVK